MTTVTAALEAAVSHHQSGELDQAEAYVQGDWDSARGLLGGKGANLADMTRLGVPVPSGLTVTT